MSKLNKETQELIETMREATKEEQESVNCYIDSISEKRTNKKLNLFVTRMYKHISPIEKDK